jgi:hypothetical protein
MEDFRASGSAGQRERPAVKTTRLWSIVTLAVVLSLAFTSCNWRRNMWRMGLGSWATDLTVYRVVPRWVYIESTLVGHGLSLTVYTPASAECAHVMQPEQPVDYVERGVGGRFLRDDVQCDTVGIGPPLVQRTRGGRGGSLRTTPIPREQATFQVVFEDEEVMLLRGRFVLASRIGWSGGHDSIAVVPNESRCRLAVEGGVASMEFRPAGRNTLSLVSREGPCRIIGLVMPPTSNEDSGRGSPAGEE